jgi:hypothetical protein
MNALTICNQPAGRVVRFTKKSTGSIALLDPKDKEIESLAVRNELADVYIELYKVHFELYQKSLAFLEASGLLQEFRQFVSKQ